MARYHMASTTSCVKIGDSYEEKLKTKIGTPHILRRPMSTELENALDEKRKKERLRKNMASIIKNNLNKRELMLERNGKSGSKQRRLEKQNFCSKLYAKVFPKMRELKNSVHL